MREDSNTDRSPDPIVPRTRVAVEADGDDDTDGTDETDESPIVPRTRAS